MNKTASAQKKTEISPLLLWVDLEMTGLDPTRDRILEVAALVTSWDFITKETYENVIFQDQSCLDGMDDWCKKTHGASGLLARIPLGVSEEQVDNDLYALCERHAQPEQHVILCGNSIWQDRRFIDAFLPKTKKRLHYRMLDVSSFKLIFSTKYQVTFKKTNKHRALDDIQESIKELTHYLSYFQVPQDAGFCRDAGKP